MEKLILQLIFVVVIFPAINWGQGETWAVYGVIHAEEVDNIDPCDIKYCILEEDSQQTVQNLTSSHFIPIYQNLDYSTATRLRDLHSSDGSNLPDNVVKFSACTSVEANEKRKNSLLRLTMQKAKKELEKKGVLYFVGQGAKVLANSGIIKDSKTNDILATMGKVKVRIPLNLSRRNQEASKL
ncbi:MAG: hypothetical protein HKN76_22550 [Saprospiraceae bacterium]|nr:hypothetical protein [Saprospiraceae bacterium]